MRTGVVLVNWNTVEDTLACVDSLKAGTHLPEVILVWDNASAGDDCDRLEIAHPDVVVRRSLENIGFAGANNRSAALLLAQGLDLVWILNNDTVVALDCLEHLHNHMAEYPGCGAVTGRILYQGTPEVIWYAGGAIKTSTFESAHLGFGKEKGGYSDRPRRIDFMTGCSMLIRAEVLLTHGLFHPDYIAYCEDLEWSLRMAQCGVRLDYLPAAELWHKGSASLKKNHPAPGRQSPRQHYLQTRNRLWTIHLRATSPTHRLRGLARHISRFLAYALANAARGRLSKTWAILRGIAHGLFLGSRTSQDLPAPAADASMTTSGLRPISPMSSGIPPESAGQNAAK